MIRGLSPFPVVIGKSQGKAQLELKAIKEQLQQNELFIADYPEIGIPMEFRACHRVLEHLIPYTDMARCHNRGVKENKYGDHDHEFWVGYSTID